MSVRWTCPQGVHPGGLGPSRPRAKALIRYCLPCSIEAGELVERVAPALERKRQAAKDRTAAKATAKRERARAARARELERETERFTVAGVDLRVELARYARLPVFGRTFTTKGLPRFDVTRREYMPNRQGFASPWEWRIHMTLTPYTGLSSARHTLIHEMVHLHVGQVGREWHGLRFRRTLTQALAEAGVKPKKDITIEAEA